MSADFNNLRDFNFDDDDFLTDNDFPNLDTDVSGLQPPPVAPSASDQGGSFSSVFDLEDFDEPAFSTSDVDELPEDFVEVEGPSSAFLWIGGALAGAFVLVMLTIVGIAAGTGDNPSAQTATARAAENLAIADSATQTAAALQVRYNEETLDAANFGTQVAETANANATLTQIAIENEISSFNADLTATAQSFFDLQTQTAVAATLAYEQTLTAMAPTITPTPAPVQGRFTGPPGFNPAGVSVELYADTNNDGQPPVFATPTPSSATSGATPIANVSTPSPATTPDVFLSREVISDDGQFAVELPGSWVFDRRLPNTGGFVAFASDGAALDFLTTNIENPSQALSISNGQGGTITIAPLVVSITSEEDLIRFFEFYIDDKVALAGATYIQNPTQQEDAENLTISASFTNGNTQGLITLISYDNTFVDITMLSEAGQFATASTTFQLIIETFRQIDNANAPTPSPTIVILPTATPSLDGGGDGTELPSGAVEGTPVGYLSGHGSYSGGISARSIPQQDWTILALQGTGTPEPEITPEPDGTAEPLETEVAPEITEEPTEEPQETETATPEPITPFSSPPQGPPACNEDTPLMLAFNAAGELEIPLLPTDCIYFLRLVLDSRFPDGAYSLVLGSTTIQFNKPLLPGEERQELEIVQGDGSRARIVLLIFGQGPTTDVTITVTTPLPSGQTLSPFDMTLQALQGVSAPTATLPSELPRGGFFQDVGNDPSSLAFLAVLGVGLVVIVVIARQLRMMGQTQNQ